MLVEFRVQNHRSLSDEQVLTLETSRTRLDDDPCPRTIAGHDQPLLPAAVLYGANASGKSNVLAAFAFMREAVLFSHRFWEPDTGVPRSPFAWGEKRHAPSVFETTFVADGRKYEYGFVVSDYAVEEEWLYMWKDNRKHTLFEREGESFVYGKQLRGPNRFIEEVTRPNALFVSVATQHKHTQLASVFLWFAEMASVNMHGRFLARSSKFASARLLAGRSTQIIQTSQFSDDDFNDETGKRIQQLLKAADLGIVDIKLSDDDDRQRGEWKQPRIQLKHKSDDDDSWLDLEDESKGTQTLFRIAMPLFRALTRGGLLLVDELESSLHPLVGLAIVRMFNSPECNPRNAQIVFTTHDTNLLGTTLGEPPLRRDQVWFTEKGINGTTALYPLTNFKPRKTENMERGYLQGRYGAIPFMGDVSWVTE